jgi:GR25 family glycosyltransferase involved in LPS biosynthesis
MYTRNEAPVLLIIFNRPDTTEKVFEAIRRAKPKRLYVSADAPRPGNGKDSIDCEKARQIVKRVDWDCEVQYRFLDRNLGCGLGVSSAISWGLENEEQIIILEDDCVPSLPFFDFCNHCLEKYKEDSRVWTINGRSHHENHSIFNNSDYVFSKYTHCCGWATWKRSWNNFDLSMQKWPAFYEEGGFRNTLFSNNEIRYFDMTYKKFYSDNKLRTHSWAIPFNFNFMSNGALAIIPKKNLIQNIGYIGVHSNGKPTKTHLLSAAEDFTFDKEPLFVLPNREYELFHFKHHVQTMLGILPLYKRAINKGLKLLGL